MGHPSAQASWVVPNHPDRPPPRCFHGEGPFLSARIALVQVYLAARREGRTPSVGSTRAWERFQSSIASLLGRAAARRRGWTGDEVEDRLQDAWAAVVQQLPGYQHDPERGRFSTWLHAVVVRAIGRSTRRQRRHPAQALTDEVQATLPARMASPIDEVEQREREDRNQREVEAILSGLRPEERALATAHWMDGLPTRKIAERQGLPAAKVQERLDRLIRKLRRAGRRARSHEIKGDVEPAPIHPNHLD